MTEAPASPARLIAPLWTVQDVAEFLQVPVQTLNSWRPSRRPSRSEGGEVPALPT